MSETRKNLINISKENEIRKILYVFVDSQTESILQNMMYEWRRVQVEGDAI